MPLMDIITGRRRREVFSGEWEFHTQDPDLAELHVGGDWSETSGNITQWNDSSGNSRNMTFASGREPTDNTSYATFNGTSDLGEVGDHLADAGAAGGAQVHIVIDNYSEGLDDTILGEFDASANVPYYQVLSSANSDDMRALFIDDASSYFGQINSSHTYNFNWSSDPRIISFVDFDTHIAMYMNGYFQVAVDLDRASAGTITPTVMSFGGRKRNSAYEKFVAMDAYRFVASHTADLTTFRRHLAILSNDFSIDVAAEQDLDWQNNVVSGSVTDNSVAGNIACESSGSGVGYMYIPFGTGTGALDAGFSAFKLNATNAGDIAFQYADDVSGTNGSAFWTYSAALPVAYFGGKTQGYVAQTGVRVRLNNNAGGAVSIEQIRLDDASGLL